MTYDPRLMKLCDALSNNCIEWKHMEKNEPYLHYAKAQPYLQPLLDAAPQSAEALPEAWRLAREVNIKMKLGYGFGEEKEKKLTSVIDDFVYVATPAMAKPEEATPDNTLPHVKAAEYGLPNPHIKLNAEESAAMEARMAEPARVLPRLKSLFDGMEGGAENPHYKAELADLEEQVAVLKKMEAQDALLDTLAGALEWFMQATVEADRLALYSEYVKAAEHQLAEWIPAYEEAEAALSRFKAYKEGV